MSRPYVATFGGKNKRGGGAAARVSASRDKARTEFLRPGPLPLVAPSDQRDSP